MNYKKVIFQPPGIKPEFCKVGLLDDDGYIYYLDEPTKIKATKCKIIPEDKAFYDKTNRCYKLIKQALNR